MKLKALFLTLCLGVSASSFATTTHFNPNVQQQDKNASLKGLTVPGDCQIEIINQSLTDVSVLGTFDDGSTVDFMIYRYESPHYISLFYNFYCHSGMHITISAPYQTLYYEWTKVNSTIRIVPYLRKAKAEVSPH